MRRFFVAGVLAAAMLALGACAGASKTVRGYPVSAYTPSAPLPIAVALRVDEAATVQSRGSSHESYPYGPMIANDLRKMKLFGNVVYPYEKGAPADAVLHLEITGSWGYYGKDYTTRDYWGGLPRERYAQGDHDVKITLTKNGRQIMSRSVSLHDKINYDGGDEDLIAARLNRAQAENIAVEVAKAIEDKRPLIMAGVLNRPPQAEAAPYAAPGAGFGPAAQPGAGPNVVSGAGVSGAGDQMNMEAGMGKKLKELEELHTQGVLSDADFGKARARLLDMRKLGDLYRNGVITLQEYQKARARIMEK